MATSGDISIVAEAASFDAAHSSLHLHYRPGRPATVIFLLLLVFAAVAFTSNDGMAKTTAVAVILQPCHGINAVNKKMDAYGTAVKKCIYPINAAKHMNVDGIVDEDVLRKTTTNDDIILEYLMCSDLAAGWQKP